MKPNQFDELAKAMARSVTRRETMKQFGYGLTTLALAALGLSTKAQAAKGGGNFGYQRCKTNRNCKPGLVCHTDPYGTYPGWCAPPSPRGGACNASQGENTCMPGLFCMRTSPVSNSGICWS